ncbi:MAG: hypothetical protein KF805_12310 [Phycisphaeraceae bacterium]|nr:hypothetical protein [Phycisphaeraceae bacterium]
MSDEYCLELPGHPSIDFRPELQLLEQGDPIQVGLAVRHVFYSAFLEDPSPESILPFIDAVRRVQGRLAELAELAKRVAALASEAAPANPVAQLDEMQSRLEDCMEMVGVKAGEFQQARDAAQHADQEASEAERAAKATGDPAAIEAARILRNHALRKLAAADQLHGRVRELDQRAMVQAAPIQSGFLDLIRKGSEHRIRMGHFAQTELLNANVRICLNRLAVRDLETPSTPGV